MRFAVIVAIALVGAAPPRDWGGAKTVTVELSNFKFAPAKLMLDHGTAYRIHLVNKASGSHDFVARQFFADSTIAADDQAKVADGAVDLDGHDTADIRLMPTKPGIYQMHCSHFMHATLGMKGTITVR